MNSQGLSPKIRKLYYDIEDGCNILYVMDKVKPGCVDHKRINKPPYKALAALPKKIENCNYAIDLGKKLNLCVCCGTLKWFPALCSTFLARLNRNSANKE